MKQILSLALFLFCSVVVLMSWLDWIVKLM